MAQTFRFKPGTCLLGVAVTLFALMADNTYLRAQSVQEDQLSARIFQALTRYDIGRLRIALDSGANPNSVYEIRDPFGQTTDFTALNYALRTTLVPYLNLKLVRTATESTVTSMVRILIRAGANVNVRYPLLTAIKAGHSASALLLLHAGAEVNSKDSGGLTALMASANQPAVWAELLKGRVSISDVDADGNTALHYACRFGDARLVGRLLGAGADPSAHNSLGDSPAQLAAPYHKALKELIDRHVMVSQDLLWYALPDLASVKLLNSHGVRIAGRNARGEPPLVASLGYHRTLRWILNAGVNVDEPTAGAPDPGYTAIMIAIKYKDPDAVAILLRHRPNLNIVAIDGQTAWTLAKLPGHEAMLRLLNCYAEKTGLSVSPR